MQRDYPFIELAIPSGSPWSTVKDFNLCHLYWLKHGWEDWNDAVQLHYEAGNHGYKNYLKQRYGFRHFEVYTLINNIALFAGQSIVSIDFGESTPQLLVNTASFFEGETRRLADNGEEDCRLFPVNAHTFSQAELKKFVKDYLKQFKEFYDGDYGVVNYIQL